MDKPKEHGEHAPRFIELDVLRGLAIALMVLYHVLWDLDYFGLVPLDNGIYQSNRAIASIFFLLVGICLVISSERTTTKRLLLHGLWIFGLGMVLTVITLIFMPEKPITFGVLHCIGLSIILSILFLRFKSYNILFAIAIIITGFIMGSYHVENPTVLHLIVGLHQAELWKYTIDYFPLFPWFGFSLLGIALGSWLYRDGKRQFPFPDLSQYKPVTMFSWLGKHSLVIYLLHQPIIAGVLKLCLFVIL